MATRPFAKIVLKLFYDVSRRKVQNIRLMGLHDRREILFQLSEAMTMLEPSALYGVNPIAVPASTIKSNRP